MKTPNSLDLIDQTILRILYTYEGITPLDLWYEIGEDDAVKEGMNEAEIRGRLESLRKQGFVERVTGPEGESGPPIFSLTTKGQDSI